MGDSSQGQWAYEFYVDPDGTAPVKDYLDRLTDATEIATVMRYINLVVGLGALHVQVPYSSAFVGHKPLCEMRPGPIRIIYVLAPGRLFLLLHAFRKRSRRTPKKEINVAMRRWEEWDKRKS